MVVTILATVFAVMFLLLGSLQLGRGIGDTIGKGCVHILSFWRNGDLIMLAGLNILIFLRNNPNELLAIDLQLQVFVCFLLVFIITNVWSSEGILRAQK